MRAACEVFWNSLGWNKLNPLAAILYETCLNQANAYATGVALGGQIAFDTSRRLRPATNVKVNNQVGRFEHVAVYCIQAFLGHWAWFLVFAATFGHPWWHTTIVWSLAVALLGAFLCTGLWGGLSKVSITLLAFAFALVPLAWALLCLTSTLELPSLAFWCGLALAFYLSAWLGGWLSRKIFQRSELPEIRKERK